MEQKSIYKDIAERTNGDIYIGVVGPVRTGKSTFIKRFMDTLVLPNMQDSAMRERTIDELPQSSAGKTIMTTEPKFIPENAVRVSLPDNASFSVRMIDCVGYIVPASLGYIEENEPRMVHTPWSNEEMPFEKAAEIGTKKVIEEHSTIGLVITTDGSISDIPREEYKASEERVVKELKSLHKPFIVLLNCIEPNTDNAKALAQELSAEYAVPVLPVNCLELSEVNIQEILTQVLFEFPIREISVDFPSWLVTLPREHWLKKAVYDAVNVAAGQMHLVRDITILKDSLKACEHIALTKVSQMELGKGTAWLTVSLQPNLFYQVLSETTGLDIQNEESLVCQMQSLASMQKEYMKLKSALDEVEATGYGIVMPTLDELKLEEPEIVKQGGKYGVKLRASAPSIHMLKANIQTEVAPIVGSESQSEDLVKYLLHEFSEDPKQIWESNIFGKSLHELVNEGLRNKLYHMPSDARMKLQETLERVINEGCNGLICIIL